MFQKFVSFLFQFFRQGASCVLRVKERQTDRQTDGQTDRSVKGTEDEVGPTENKNFGRSHSDKYADLNRTLTIFAKIKHILQK